ncbi:MAG: transporter [Smithellaceae bacterium]
MNLKKLMMVLLVLTVSVLPILSWAAHPLITDDTGTQGKGKFQLELNGKYDSKKENVNGVSVQTTGGQVTATLSYGIVENIDLVLSIPYQWGKTEENEANTYDEKGFSDTVLEAKWRFFKKKGYSLALKPGIIIPTGNDEKGLGTGRVGGHLFLIGSKELGTWAFHANLGYIRNENKADEQKNLWHASLATTWEVVKNLKLVGNIGIERNPDDNAKSDPAFLIGGVIYSVAENIDLDCGAKYGLNSSETDLSLMAGIAIRF